MQEVQLEVDLTRPPGDDGHFDDEITYESDYEAESYDVEALDDHTQITQAGAEALSGDADPNKIDFGLGEEANQAIVDQVDFAGGNQILPETNNTSQLDATVFEENEISWEDGDGGDGTVDVAQEDTSVQDQAPEELRPQTEGASIFDTADDEIGYEDDGPAEENPSIAEEGTEAEVAEEYENQDQEASGDARDITGDASLSEPGAFEEIAYGAGEDGLGEFEELSEANQPDASTQEANDEEMHHPEDDNDEDDEGQDETQGAVPSTMEDLQESEPYASGEHSREESVSADVEAQAADDDMEGLVEDVLPTADSSAASVQSPGDANGEIPAITVMYKDVEYPLFYNSPGSDGKECFFDDLGLLDCSMDDLLGSFRRELAGELGPFDELVFQVDELGLEFAESSQHDIFSEVNLRRMLEIFDQLVKNQDPDASKPLYAYLVTRQSSQKRWVSLIEDAFAGKGLDEVCYYFTASTQSGTLDGGAHVEASPSAQYQEQSDDEAGEDATSEHSNYEAEAQVAVDAPETNDLQAEEHQPHEDEDPPITDEFVADFIETTAGEDDPVTPGMDANYGTAETNFDDNHAIGVFAEEQDQHAMNNAPGEDPSNPLLEWEGEDVDFLEEAQDEMVNESNYTTSAIDEAAAGTMEMSTSKVTPNSSATATVNGDDINPHTQIDLIADAVDFGHETNDDAAQDRGADDFDWGDLPEPGGIELGTTMASPSVTGKRARDDADDDLQTDEDENGVKRRRS